MQSGRESTAWGPVVSRGQGDSEHAPQAGFDRSGWDQHALHPSGVCGRLGSYFGNSLYPGRTGHLQFSAACWRYDGNAVDDVDDDDDDINVDNDDDYDDDDYDDDDDDDDVDDNDDDEDDDDEDDDEDDNEKHVYGVNEKEFNTCDARE